MPGGRERKTPLMMGRVLGEQDSLGATAERFFSEGEELESRGWDEIVPSDDALEPPRHRGRRGSVDKVPRRLSAVIGSVLLLLCVGVGAALGGFALFAKSSLPSWFEEKPHESAATSPPEQPPAQTPRPESQVIAQPPAQAPSQLVAQPHRPTEAPAALPTAASDIPNTAILPDLEGAERLRQDAIAVRKRRQQKQIENDYIWSQELKALVRASSLEQAPAQPNAASHR